MARTTIDIEEAAAVLRTGGVVGMPTETVYGLAGRIDLPQAVRRIFEIKGRPLFDPLIVHVSSVEQARRVVGSWPEAASRLAERFWPGPVSLVLPKRAEVDELITAGLVTVAVRMPRHTMARELIERCGGPVAAPSANKFGKTSPTTAGHVASEFADEDLLVLDGGACEVGVESSVVAVEEDESGVVVRVLRPGMVTGELVREALAGLEFRVERGWSRASPGHMEKHYQPAIPLALVSGMGWSDADVVRALEEQLGREHLRVGWLKISQDAVKTARTLYAQMRGLSEGRWDAMAARIPEGVDGEAWEAIRDRLRRASSVRLEGGR